VGSFGQPRASQPERYFFDHYAIEQGLSQGSGYAIGQHDGFIWIGTQDGLNRFDGHQFKVYRSGKKRSIRDNFIQCLLTNRQHFWVGTVKGIDIYDATHDEFRSFNEQFGLAHNVNDVSIKKLLLDRQGCVWIMTDEQGMYRFNPATRQIQSFLKESNNLMDFTMADDGTIWIVADDETYYYDSKTATLRAIYLRKTLNLSVSTIFRAIISDTDGNIWIGTYEDGIYVIKPSKTSYLYNRHTTVHHQARANNGQLASNQITCFFRDKSNQIWIGSRTAGISLYRPRSHDFVHIRHNEKMAHSLAANYIISFFADQQNNIWIGLSGGGVDKFDPRNAPFHLIQRNTDDPANSLPDNMVFKLFGFNNQLYIGTQSGGLARYTPATEAMHTFRPNPATPNSLPNSQVYDIDADSAQQIWLATGGGLVRFSPKTDAFTAFPQGNQKTLLYLYALNVLNNQQEIWTGGQRGLYRFNLRTKSWLSWDDLPALKRISGYVVRLIYEDSQQNIWLGTLGHGLIRYSPQSKRITVFDQASGFPCNNIRSILENNGMLWVGTDCGLSSINLATQSVSGSYTTKDGLPNNVIYGILIDKRGYLWLSSNKGLTRFLPVSRYVKNYDSNNGLQSNEFNTNCAYQMPNETFFFGGVKGISYFNVHELRPNTFIPPIKLTQLKIQDSLYNTQLSDVVVSHNQNFIDFSFAALNFSNSEKNTYRFLLEGINTDWVNAGTQTQATYTNLPPGRYVFRVKGSNDDGIENSQAASIRIHIQPAYYQTWWFISLLLLLGSGLLLLTYRSYTSYQLVRIKLEREEAIRHQKESELKEQAGAFRLKLAETEMAALRSQMNPHFIFNCLNSIQFFMVQNKAEKASEYLTKFARLIRLVLENSRSERVTLDNELETLRLYIEMEAMRFPDKLRYTMQLAPNIPAEAIEIPPLLLQPFVENAIWHGLMHKDEGGTVNVMVYQPKDDLLQVDITDNGIGRQQAAQYKSKSATKSKSFGMKLTADRIAMINQFYHTQAHIEVIDLTDKQGISTGTKVIVNIPI
jgi:ligand-binding sensor domain-containing protein